MRETEKEQQYLSLTGVFFFFSKVGVFPANFVVAGPKVGKSLLDSESSEAGGGVPVPALFHHLAQDAEVLKNNEFKQTSK